MVAPAASDQQVAPSASLEDFVTIAAEEDGRNGSGPENGNQIVAILADRVGLSPSPCLKRVRLLLT